MRNVFLLLIGVLYLGITSCDFEKKSQAAEVVTENDVVKNTETPSVPTQATEVASSKVITEEPVRKEDNTTKVEKEVSEDIPLPEVPVKPGDFDRDYLMGKFEPSKHKDFIKISSKYASRSDMMMRKDAYDAFKSMYEAAKKDGVYLKIISATRPFHHQKRIWEAKWQGKRKVDGQLLPVMVKDSKNRALKILRYSSMPGTSRHHWGTDIDLNDLNNRYFESGTGKKIYDWLVINAASYGFCQPYSVMDHTRLNGYQEEKWHWSYTPVSKILTNQYKTLIGNEDIGGFDGSETATQINMVDNYVLGISQNCH